ncbi:MAG: stage V sporulation protein S, partial [Caldilineae bacterium]
MASSSHVGSTAGAIAHTLRRYETVRLRAIGAHTTYLAVKAVALASHYLRADGYHVCMEPSFRTIPIDGRQKTVVEFL